MTDHWLAMDSLQFVDALDKVYARRFPRCWDCADDGPLCPNSNLPCDLTGHFDRLKAAIRPLAAPSAPAEIATVKINNAGATLFVAGVCVGTYWAGKSSTIGARLAADINAALAGGEILRPGMLPVVEANLQVCLQADQIAALNGVIADRDTTIAQLSAEVDAASEWMDAVRQACRDATGGNTTFIDDDVARAIHQLKADRGRLFAELETARADKIATINLCSQTLKERDSAMEALDSARQGFRAMAYMTNPQVIREKSTEEAKAISAALAKLSATKGV